MNFILISVLILQLLFLLYIVGMTLYYEKRFKKTSNCILTENKANNKLLCYILECMNFSILEIKENIIHKLQLAIKNEKFEDAAYYNRILKEIDNVLDQQEGF